MRDDESRLFVERVRACLRDWGRAWHRTNGGQYVAVLERLSPTERAALIVALEEARRAMSALNRPFLNVE